MNKDKESILKEGDEVFFFYDKDFQKYFYEGSKERNDRRIHIKCKKEYFYHFYYLHKVFHSNTNLNLFILILLIS